MQFKYFIGVDISKETLDFALVVEGNNIFHVKCPNNLKDIKKVIHRFQTEHKVEIFGAVFCMEHTGIYCNILLRALQDENAHIWIESATRIKVSGGLQRGKNDKIDSIRIAAYAWRNRDQIKLSQIPRAQIQQIRSLLAVRSRLVNNKKQLQTPLKECKRFVSAEIYQIEKALLKAPLKAITHAITETELKILQAIKEDSQLKNLFELVTSIDGIGLIIAANLITVTNEFKDFKEAKKFACYSGVAPFDHSSGKSLKVRPRVSSMANKSIKCLLHLAAVTVIRMKGELKEFYQRKVEEGKSKMSVLNAVRNKLVLRIFAVVRKNRKYEKNYIVSLG